MLMTLSGIVTLVSREQYENTSFPMVLTLSGMVTLARFVQE